MKNNEGKKKKTAKGYRRMLITMLIGGLIGGVIGGVTAGFDITDKVVMIVSDLSKFTSENYKVIMGILFLAFAAVNLALFYKMSKSIKRMRAEDDDEKLDKMETAFSNDYDITSVINLIFYAIAFAMFAALVSNHANGHFLIDVVFFIVYVVLYGVQNVAVVNLYKKYDPMKKGNPSSLSFHKDWIESSDESEQLQMYKTGFETLVPTTFILIAGFGVSVILSMFYPPAGAAVIITCLMLIAYAIVSGYISIRNNNIDK